MGKGGYVRIGEEDDSTTVIFCLPEKVGVLADALKIFQVSKQYIEFIIVSKPWMLKLTIRIIQGNN